MTSHRKSTTSFWGNVGEGTMSLILAWQSHKNPTSSKNTYLQFPDLNLRSRNEAMNMSCKFEHFLSEILKWIISVLSILSAPKHRTDCQIHVFFCSEVYNLCLLTCFFYCRNLRCSLLIHRFFWIEHFSVSSKEFGAVNSNFATVYLIKTSTIFETPKEGIAVSSNFVLLYESFKMDRRIKPVRIF